MLPGLRHKPEAAHQPHQRFIGMARSKHRNILAALGNAMRIDQTERPAGNRLARQLALVIDVLGRIETWQRHPGLAELKRDDRRLLAPSFRRLARDARSIAELIDDRWPHDSVEDAA